MSMLDRRQFMAFLLASVPGGALATQVIGADHADSAWAAHCLPMLQQIHDANPHIDVIAQLAWAQWPAATDLQQNRQFIEQLGDALSGPEYRLLERVGVLAREDFAEDRIITLSGWMLSEAEVRFCMVLERLCQAAGKG